MLEVMNVLKNVPPAAWLGIAIALFLLKGKGKGKTPQPIKEVVEAVKPSKGFGGDLIAFFICITIGAVIFGFVPIDNNTGYANSQAAFRPSILISDFMNRPY